MQPHLNLAYLTLEPPREGHASHTHVTEIIKGLEKRGWRVTLYKPSYTNKATSPSLPLRLLLCLWLQIQMWSQWKRGQVLYCRAHYLAFPSALVAKIFGVPIIHEVNGPYDDVFIAYPSLLRVKSLLIWTQRKQYEWANIVIAVTQQLCKIISMDINGRQVHFVRNGANTELFKSGYERPANAPLKYAIFFGSMAKWHRIDDILQAFAKPAWPSDTDLVLIGDGADKPLVDAAAASNSRIHALGRMKPADMPQYIANALCGLVTTSNVTQSTEGGAQAATGSRAETGLYPLKLFETLACGTAAIVTDYPGQADLVRDGACGIVVAPDAPDEIANAVARLSADENTARAMGERAEVLVKQNHSWDRSAEETHDIITKNLRLGAHA